jgi:hypothetical protein
MYNTKDKLIQTDLYLIFSGGVGQLILMSLNSNNASSAYSPTQIVDLSLIPKKCQRIPNYPIQVSLSGISSSPSGLPLVCGGYPATSACYGLSSTGWSPRSSMSIPRNMYGFAFNRFSKEILFVALGSNNDYGYSIEFYHASYGGWLIADVQFPIVIRGNCAVFINESTVLNIGGVNWKKMTPINYTFFVTLTTIVRGPSLKISRERHGCARIFRNSTSSDYVYIVAGGLIDLTQPTDSVEIFDPQTNEWSDGVPLPFPIDASSMTEDTLGGVLIAGGQTSESQLGSSYILHLPHAGLDASWMVLSQTLTGLALRNNAIVLPSSLTGLC